MSLYDNFIGCMVLIHNKKGELLTKTRIVDYDRKYQMIKVEHMPDLDRNQILKLFILAHPSPCEYKGRIVRIGKEKEIALFSGEEKEQRQAIRYKIDMSAIIENVVEEGILKPASPLIKVDILDISTHGFSFIDEFSKWNEGDILHIRPSVGIEESPQVWVVQVVRSSLMEDEKPIYGCRFLLVR